MDGAGQNQFFHVTSGLRHALGGKRVVNRCYVLRDNRPGIQFFRHIMGRCANQLHAPGKRLTVRAGPDESGQEGMVNVDDAVCQVTDEVL